MDEVTQSIAQAPLPTPKTLRSRTSIPYQLMRFVAFNFKMLKMVRKGHH